MGSEDGTKLRFSFRRAPGGPYTVTRFDSAIEAVSVTGRTASVSVGPAGGHTWIKDELIEGIDVLVDGVVVGQLFQKHHGTWRRDRGIDFVPVDPQRFPSSPLFRLRRVKKVVCENDDGELIGPPWFIPLGGGRLNVAPGVGEELVLIYVAVASGMIGVMGV